MPSVAASKSAVSSTMMASLPPSSRNTRLIQRWPGALVGVQPFGGFNLSGTDTKAGGPDYLLHFLQMKTVAERF